MPGDIDLAVEDGRGKLPVDQEAVTRLVSAVSCFGAAGARVKEFDLNPVLAGPEGATAVDWLMVLEQAG